LNRIDCVDVDRWTGARVVVLVLVCDVSFLCRDRVDKFSKGTVSWVHAKQWTRDRLPSLRPLAD